MLLNQKNPSEIIMYHLAICTVFAAKFRPAGLPAGTWKALEKIRDFKHQRGICKRDQQFWFKQENRPLAKECESVEMHTQTIKKPRFVENEWRFHHWGPRG